MIVIDGSAGEGGGQVLRTSLALSMVTGTAFRIERIRAGRKKPGLLNQHLTGLRAAAEISGATVRGAELGSRELEFTPGLIPGGEYTFSVGTAGSAGLVFQTVFPALLSAAAPSRVTFEGGTHNSAAPPFDFLDRAFLPLARRMGAGITARLERPGFYPAGGGRFTVEVAPSRLSPLTLLERGDVRRLSATIYLSRLPSHVADRERRALEERLELAEVEVVTPAHAVGPGNAVVVEVESEHVTEVFTGFGERGLRAEQVAEGVAREVEAYLTSGLPVGEHLADQLILLLALAGGGSFRTGPLSGHARTQLETIARFLEVQVEARAETEDSWRPDAPANSPQSSNGATILAVS